MSPASNFMLNWQSKGESGNTARTAKEPTKLEKLQGTMQGNQESREWKTKENLHQLVSE
jgi:hypothetical protein